MTPKTSGDFHGDSLPFQVVEFFRRNLDEELSSDDIAIKFGLSSQREVVPRLARPVSGGWLRVVRKEQPEYARRPINVYGAGYKLTQVVTA